MFSRRSVPVVVGICLLAGLFLMGQDHVLQSELCGPDPCGDIPNAVPDTCSMVPGGWGPDDFSCLCEPGYTWDPAAHICDLAVVFSPDPNLEQYVRNAFSPPLVGDILKSDLLKLTVLLATSADIVDLAGLEYCTNLTVLYLNGDQISDLTPLSGLTNLTMLGLYSNQISDLTPLSGLTNLTLLNLGYNQISDIAPLVANVGLGAWDSVILTENLLSHESCTVHVPVLEGRGVDVSHDC